MPPTIPPSTRSKLLTVSELTSKIKQILEDAFPFVWVTGEVSNIRIPASGHHYFTLKDDAAQIGAVMFRGQIRALKFDIEDGMTVSGLGRVSVYEPRGTYQVILEYLEPKGVGALQAAFEQLKRRLADQGYFDDEHKKPLPFLPARIAVVTSPSGAVLQDILQILNRRFPGVQVDVVPVRVQGAGAEDEIAAGLQLVDRHGKADVVILARGGGSLEDLQAYNSEKLAMAVFNAATPIISAVGHETDYTITDFVADLRAPTPSAAAELVIPLKADLTNKIKQLQLFISYHLRQLIKNNQRLLTDTAGRLKDPKRRIHDFRLALDDTSGRISRAAKQSVERRAYHHRLLDGKLLSFNPMRYVLKAKAELEYSRTLLRQHLKTFLQVQSGQLTRQQTKLETLNPLAILSRGYSVTRTIPQGAIVTDSSQVDLGQRLEVLLAKGRLSVEIHEKADGEH